LIFPPAGVKLLGYHSKARGTLLHHQRRTLLHCHHQLRKKESTAATLAAMSELVIQKESTAVTLAAMSELVTQLTISNAILQGQVNTRATVAPATCYASTPAFSGQYDLLDFNKTFDRYIYY
jgi:hypothetical protein